MGFSVDPSRSVESGHPDNSNIPIPKSDEDFGVLFEDIKKRPNLEKAFIKTGDNLFKSELDATGDESKIPEVKEEPENNQKRSESHTQGAETQEDKTQPLAPFLGIIIDLSAIDIKNLATQPRQTIQDIILKYVDKIESLENTVKFRFKGSLEITFTKQDGKTLISIFASEQTLRLLNDDQALLINFLQKTFEGEDIEIEFGELGSDEFNQNTGQDHDQNQNNQNQDEQN